MRNPAGDGRASGNGKHAFRHRHLTMPRLPSQTPPPCPAGGVAFLSSKRSTSAGDDDVHAESLAWSAYSEAVAANDQHRSVATERCRNATFAAWRHVYLEKCGAAKP